MNKKLLIMATAALFAACASNDVKNDIEESLNEIDFNAATYKTTRAEITSNANLATENGFVVWGYKAKYQASMNWATDAYTVFNGINVYVKSGEDGAYIEGTGTDWTYADKKYWDKNASYCFYAVAPYNPTNGTYSISDANVANNEKKITITGATSGLASNSDDFLIARGGVKNRRGNTTDNVNFVFNHTMAKVDFLLKKGSNVNGVVKVQKITMSGWDNGAGTFAQTSETTPGNISHTEWTIPSYATTAGQGTIDVLTTESAELTTTGAATTTLPCIMVPQTISQGLLTFTINFTIGDEQFLAHEGSLTTQQVWGTDSHITYTLTIDPAAIEFDVQSIAGFTNVPDPNGAAIIQ